MTKKTIRWWLFASFVVALGAAPFLARGDADQRQTRQANQQQIAQLSESQYERLKRNQQVYRKMTPTEQDRILAFHAQLQRDQTEGNGELSRVLAEYQDWLKTLQPYQRDQLANTPDPGERIALMKRFVKVQRESAANRSMLRGPRKDEHEARFWEWIKQRSPGVPVLSPEELSRIMGAIESSAKYQINSETWNEIDQHEGIVRYVRLMQALKRSAEVNAIVFDRPKAIEDAADRIDQLTENSEVREFMREIDPEEKDRVPSKGFRLAQMLFKSFYVLLRERQRNATEEPTNEDLLGFFEQLSEPEQDALLSLEASDFHEDLNAQLTRPNLEFSVWDLGGIFWGPPNRNFGGRGPDPRFRSRGPGDREPADREPSDRRLGDRPENGGPPRRPLDGPPPGDPPPPRPNGENPRRGNF
ncbi:MAG: hypothetical protein KDA80_02925 [Planctomycetaceae bacterium]|nr:hypothetical protein [Planctomycetaceae bacterium]